MATDEEKRSREWVLDAETEYRFELDVGSSLAIKVMYSSTIFGHITDGFWLQLLRGRAEIFGAEMVDGKIYLFYEECKAAVFTWQGCTIEISLSYILV